MTVAWLPGAERIPSAKAAGNPYTGGPFRVVRRRASKSAD